MHVVPQRGGEAPGDAIVAAVDGVGGKVSEGPRALAQDRRVEVVGAVGTAHFQSRGDRVGDPAFATSAR